MSDISFENLTGLYAMVGAWWLAALFGLAAVVLTIVAGVTGERTTWGRRALVSWALTIGCFVSGYALMQLGLKIRNTLDETMHYWAPCVAVLGGYACFRAGRRRSADT